jgi:RNA polymerase sigma-70 factor (ECF subfamily)
LKNRTTACGYFHRSITGQEISTWHVEAAIAAIYASAPSSGAIPWPAILNEYDFLVTFTNSPVVLLNRAVVVGRVHGPAAGLAALEPLEEQRFFHDYYLAHAIRGNLLMQLNRFPEAEAAFTRALECTCSEPEKQFVRARLALSQS